MNDEEKIIIPIVLAADDNYAPHLGVTMVSVLENLNKQRRVKFYILDNNLSLQNKENLQKIESEYYPCLEFIPVSVKLINVCPEFNHLSVASYSRLLISDLLPPDIDRVIYLDSDVVVLGDIFLLYNQDLCGHVVGAVRDVMAEEILRIYFYPGLNNYFNAGILLINLESWRQKSITEKAFNFIRQYRQQIIRADQDVLNCVVANDWQPLEQRFNLDLKRESFYMKPVDDTIVLHYSDKAKPWHYIYFGCTQKYYFQYLAKTPWGDFQFIDKNWKNIVYKGFLICIKLFKRWLRSLLPGAVLDIYRRCLWKTYKIKN